MAASGAPGGLFGCRDAGEVVLDNDRRVSVPNPGSATMLHECETLVVDEGCIGETTIPPSERRRGWDYKTYNEVTSGRILSIFGQEYC